MKTRFTEKSGSHRNPNILQPSLRSGEGVKIEESVTIDLSPEEIYAFWRRLENLPRFMNHLESVSQVSDGTSHWVMKTSSGKRLEWDAHIIEDKPGQMISWQSLPGADVDNAGSVWFTPSETGRGTFVKVSMKYSPPGGKIGAAIARFFGDSGENEVAEDLGRLKVLLENRG
jgi:uncharacterized membrane protein